MQRLVMGSAIALAVAAPAVSGEQTVTYKSGDETVSAFLAAPEGKGPFPAVVVIQEWWGLNDWVKDQARALARRATSRWPWTSIGGR